MENTPIFRCITLVDITPTYQIRGTGTDRDQQRNWETVLQVLGLKTQPEIIKPVESIVLNLDDYNPLFGEFYQGEHKMWYFSFQGGRTDVYNIEELEKDFTEVPIILGLEETARFMLPIFFGTGTLKNIYFDVH